MIVCGRFAFSKDLDMSPTKTVRFILALPSTKSIGEAKILAPIFRDRLIASCAFSRRCLERMKIARSQNQIYISEIT